jgi:hypothetical protein
MAVTVYKQEMEKIAQVYMRARYGEKNCQQN